MYISGSRALLASVAFCAGMAGPALALPLAGGTALAPLGAHQTAAAQMAGLLILAEAEGETGDEDAGGTDEGAAEDGDTSLGDPADGRDGCDNCRGEDETGTDPGDDAGEDVTEGEMPDGEVTEGEVTDGDGMAWAGGSPDFCEACGGEVVSEETVQTTATRSDRSAPRGTSFSRKERGADLREGCRGTAKVACRD